MYAIIDLETTIKKSFKRTANPLDSANYIVYAGIKKENGSCWTYPTNRIESLFLSHFGEITYEENKIIEPVKLLVGHNIKFDLLYIWKYPEIQNWIKNGGQVWDTQLVEYLLTGQQSKMSALRKIAENVYACKPRPKYMEEYWEKGICTSDIPKDIVIKDLTDDLLDTESVYLQQIKKVKELGMMDLIKSQMNCLLATTEMEYNGLFVDTKKLEQLTTELCSKIVPLLSEINQDILQYWPNEIGNFNLQSKDHLSSVFFGGNLSYIGKEVILDESGNSILYKSGIKKGQIKTKNMTKSVYIPGILPASSLKTMTKKIGVYQVGEKILIQLAKQKNEGGILAKKILNFRGLMKQYNTYFLAFTPLVNPDTGCIHHKLNHTTTSTGRLSGTDPNMQNVPGAADSSIKQVFVSRFKEGLIVEVDYSQLEIVAQAWLANDTNMIEDIVNGVDFHCKRLAFTEKMSYTDIIKKIKDEKDPLWIDKRKKIKTVSFQRSYGAGANKISEETGLSIEEVKEIISAEEVLYPNIVEYNNKIFDLIVSSRQGSSNRTESGEPAGISEFKSVTGRKYIFVEQDTPDFIRKTGKRVAFKPTEIKNYPVQGLATGDIVPHMVGILYRKLQGRHDVKLINTVHDSILLDIKPNVNIDFIKEILENTQEELQKGLGINFDIPLKVEVKSGSSWWHAELGE